MARCASTRSSKVRPRSDGATPTPAGIDALNVSATAAASIEPRRLSTAADPDAASPSLKAGKDWQTRLGDGEKFLIREALNRSGRVQELRFHRDASPRYHACSRSGQEGMSMSKVSVSAALAAVALGCSITVAADDSDPYQWLEEVDG